MKLLYLNYDPSKRTHRIEDGSNESREQHAARVHHNAAKRRRAAAFRNPRNPPTIKRPNSTNLDGGKINDLRRGRHDQSLVLRTQQPRSVLGAGRIDPFDAYCHSDSRLIVHEMIDHAVSNQWTLFAANDRPESLLIAKKAVMDATIRYPFCYHTMVFSGATHKAFHVSPHVEASESAMLRLKSKVQALNALRTYLDSSRAICQPDELLLCMLILTAVGHGEKVVAAESLDRKTLAAQQDGQFYGSMEQEWQHFKALVDIVKAREDGLHSIRFPGLAVALASFDTHTSLMHHTRPYLPLFMPSKALTSSWATTKPQSAAAIRNVNLGAGFSFLTMVAHPAAHQLLDTIEGIRLITIAFDAFQLRDPDAPDIKHIIFARNMNQHELLDLPILDQDPFSHVELGPTESALYELCRLSCIIFQLTVLLPNLTKNLDVVKMYAKLVLSKLSERRSMEHATFTSTFPVTSVQDLELWIGVMSAWLVKDTSMYTWFIDFAARNLRARRPIGLGDSGHMPWESAKTILAQYLWLDSECDGPCATIWQDVLELLPI
jgi:hypothetical protein